MPTDTLTYSSTNRSPAIRTRHNRRIPPLFICMLLCCCSTAMGSTTGTGFSTGWFTGLFILIALAVMGIYNCVIFIMRRSDSAPLWFGIFSLLIAFNNFVSNSGISFLAELFPDLSVLPLRRMDIVTVIAAIPAFVMFTHAFYPRLGSRTALRAVQATAAMACLGTATLPERSIEWLFRGYFVVILLSILYCVAIGIRAARGRLPDARGVLAGIAALSIAGVNDVLWGYGMPHTRIIMPYATLVFTLIYSILISRRFAAALADAERLNAELIENQRLREEMRRRMTQEEDLRLAQRRLTGLLHSIEVPLCALNESGTIVFCNRAFEEFSGEPLSRLLGRTMSDCAGIDNRKTRRTSVPLDMDDEPLCVMLFDSPENDLAPSGSAVHFVEELNRHRTRIRSLETLLTGANPALVESSPDLQHDLEAIDTALAQIGNLLSSDKRTEQLKKLGIEVMSTAIKYWTECTSTSKFELAEESTLWKIHTNPDGWRRTQTLDRYLDGAAFPQNPRWNQIFKTADFVLIRCQVPGAARTRLETAVQNLATAVELAR